MHSTGRQIWRGRQTPRTACLGVLVCAERGCGWVTRPLTTKSRRDEQLTRTCGREGCESISHVHIKCDAAVYVYEEKDTDTGEVYSVWEHVGEHRHASPPGGPVTTGEKAQVDAQVVRRPGASAHALRTGDPLPGSVPLADINPKLADPRTARYQLQKSQERMGILASGSSRGGFSGMETLKKLKDEFKGTFIVDMPFLEEFVIVFQNDWMRQRLCRNVDLWSAEREGEQFSSLPVQFGAVTDGDHKFFKSGTLILTCVFDTTLEGWVPVLYTWVDRQDTDHLRHHFRWLFRCIIEHAGDKFDPKMLFNVSYIN